MSSTFSAESAASRSDLSEQECGLSPSAKLIPSADASSPSTGLEYPSTPMSPSLRLKMLAPSMSSAAASPVRTSAELAARRALPESAADFGLSLLGSLASYDPASCSWKTSQTSLFGGLTEFSETWPRSGMLRSGTAYQLAPLAPLTNGIESGLLPTPTSGSGRTGAHHPFDGGSRARAKARALGLLPTPRASDADRGGRGDLIQVLRGNKRNSSHKLLPTPRRCSGLRSSGSNRTELYESTGQLIGKATLRPFVEWMMGYPAGWAALAPSETPSPPTSPNSSEGRS
jgi:hypothetical protein